MFIPFPYLLVIAFRSIVDELDDYLEPFGFGDVRPAHGFAFAAIASGASTGEIARRLDITKQAAAQLISTLEAAGYVKRSQDGADRRVMRLRLTSRGRRCTELVDAFFAARELQWSQALGATTFTSFRTSLETIVKGTGDGALRIRPVW